MRYILNVLDLNIKCFHVHAQAIIRAIFALSRMTLRDWV